MARSFRRSRKVRRPRTTKRRRSFRRRGGRRMGDTVHFHQTVNGGTLVSVTANEITSTGGFIIRLSDLPLYQQMAPNFEFARLNKCSIEFWPKSNMQLNQITTDVGALTSTSLSGTLVTAIDQVPFYSGAGGFTTATTWVNDSSNDTGVSSASAVSTPFFSTDYVRGLQGSREKELYKKHKISFYPAFYDYIMTGTNPVGGAITGVVNTTGDPILADTTFTTNGSVERKIKKWITTQSLQSGSATITATNGPLYFGPIYALDINVPGTTASVPLFDIRFRYSISFKRLRGV